MEKLGRSDIANNLTTTSSGKALDARQGKILNDMIMAGRKTLTNSTYYPPSYLYKSGRSMYLRCAGLYLKDIPENVELIIAVAGSLPEEYYPDQNLITFVPINLNGDLVRVSFDTEGKITYLSPKARTVGDGINLHVSWQNTK